MVLNIDSSEVAKFTDKLRQMHRSKLPNAVRTTLSKAAFNVKTKTMPKTSSEFTNRTQNFFKANSKVIPAKGWNIADMESVVGFVPKNTNKLNKAIKELEQQEYGGIIKNRDFIADDAARTGGMQTKNVRPINRLVAVKNIIDTKNTIKGRQGKQKFIRSAFAAMKLYGNNGLVLNRYGGGRATLSRITNIKSDLKGQKLVIERTPIYSYKLGRHVSVKGRGFMKRASYESALNLDLYYIAEARKQIESIR